MDETSIDFNLVLDITYSNYRKDNRVGFSVIMTDDHHRKQFADLFRKNLYEVLTEGNIAMTLVTRRIAKSKRKR